MAITLLPLDVQAAHSMSEGDRTFFAAAPNADDVAPILVDAAMAQAHLYRHTQGTAPWIGYMAQAESNRDIVGVCTFIGAPQDGVVEIAYHTFEGYEGQGFGGDMATALVDIALGDEAVDTIVAHTRPGDTPEAKILQRLGFEHSGVLEDPEAETVWLWALERVQPDEPGIGSSESAGDM